MTDDDLLKKWLNNKLTDAEKKAFSKREDYAIDQNIIENAKCFKASEVSKIDDFENFKANYQVRSSAHRLKWLRPALRIAAVLVIGLAIYFTMFMNESVVEQRTLLAEKTTISLPDLSKVTLNADSEITYNKDSWHEERQIDLKGEAYFKVAKGKTFDVITEKGTITVVGTEFNVKARHSFFEVVCYEGVVKVKSDTIARQLLAGETFKILNGKFSQNRAEETFPQWITNRSSFKSVPLHEVFEELKRQYNIKVTYENTDASRLFTGGFVHGNLENALLAITQPMNLTFEISSSNQVLIHDNTD